MFAECFAPYFLRLDPDEAVARTSTDADPAVRVFGTPFACASESEFATWLHQALAMDDWFGNDVAALTRAYQEKRGSAASIVWFGSEHSRQCGVDVARLRQDVVTNAPSIQVFLA